MALLTGAIMSQNLAGDEEFSYEWCIPKFKDGYSYRSPKFGSTCKEFSDCHLEIKTSFFLQDKMRIFLCSSRVLSGWKFTFIAEVTEGMSPLPNIHCSADWIDFRPQVQIFEIQSFRSRHTFSNRFTFRLDLKLRRDLSPTHTISDKSISLHVSKTKSKTKVDRINKDLNTTTRIQISKAFNNTLNRSCCAFDVVDPFLFHHLPFHQSSSDQAVSDLHPADNKEPNTTDNDSSKELLQDGKSTYTFNMEETDRPSLPLQLSSPDQPVPKHLGQDKEEKEKAQHLVYPNALIQDFRALYTSGHMCDLDIRIGDRILRAHKLILSARSPVFKAMMEHDCLESSSNTIAITDCSAPPFDEFLKYLYTGEIEDSTIDTVMALYSLSDKYDVPALREACSGILQNKLSSKSVDDVANTVCDVLQLADFHNDSKLKDLASSFIVNHFSVVSNKQSWKDLMKSNFELTSEILALVVNVCQKIQT